MHAVSSHMLCPYQKSLSWLQVSSTTHSQLWRRPCQRNRNTGDGAGSNKISRIEAESAGSNKKTLQPSKTSQTAQPVINAFVRWTFKKQPPSYFCWSWTSRRSELPVHQAILKLELKQVPNSTLVGFSLFWSCSFSTSVYDQLNKVLLN